jgi:redox-sensing transcriptional repressor
MSQKSSSTGGHQPAAATGARQREERSPRKMPTPSHAADMDEAGTTAHRRRGVAPVTVGRLIRCHHLCTQLRRDGRERVSSGEIGHSLGCRPSLIRKDFSRVGKLGTRGHGYRIAGLLRVLEEFLGGGRPVAAVLVGTGALGAALLSRGGFARDGLRFLAAFDFDPSRAGARCDGLVVEHASRMPDVLGALDVDVGVLAVSETEARGAAQLLAENGVRAILNLTPAILPPRRGVVVSNIDLATELAKLAFYAASARGRPGEGGAAPGDRRDHARAGVRRCGGDLAVSRAAEPRGRDVLAVAGGTGQ